MKVVKQTDEYTIFQKRSGRYAVADANKALINGEDKARVLLEAGLIKVTLPKPPVPEEEAVEEVEAAAEEAGEEPAAE